MDKKVGRPTDSKKDSIIKLRVDERTKRMLEYCEMVRGSTKSGIVRDLIEKEYLKLKELDDKNEQK